MIIRMYTRSSPREMCIHFRHTDLLRREDTNCVPIFLHCNTHLCKHSFSLQSDCLCALQFLFPRFIQLYNNNSNYMTQVSYNDSASTVGLQQKLLWKIIKNTIKMKNQVPLTASYYNSVSNGLQK